MTIGLVIEKMGQTMNWALYGKWTNKEQQWWKHITQLPKQARQIKLLNLEEEGENEFDNEKGKGLPSLIVFGVLVIKKI